MPFVKKTDAKDAQRPTDARKIFIGRTDELHFFREEILKPEDPAYNIISISGQGGVGKTTLLFRFIDDARATEFKQYCLAARVDQRQATPASVMEKFADQLRLEGDFEKALKQYKEVLRKLQGQREAAREAFMRKAATEVVGSATQAVPIVGGVLKEGAVAATTSVFEELHFRQLLKDAERMEDPVGDLTSAFVKELNRLTETSITMSSNRRQRQRAILFFDTFEQLAAECAPWLLDYFLEADVSNNVVLVIAGRDALEDTTPDDPKRWLPYRDSNTIYPISLNSFTEEETRRYLAERGITDAERIETIWQLSHGLPLYLGFLTSNPQGKVDPTANVVANFLRWIPKQEQVKRRLALDAALFSRPFNQDELGAFTYVSEQERPTLYYWLTVQPFVQSTLQDGRYGYHELAQELFSRHLYQRSQDEYYVTRRCLAEYYQRLLERFVAEGGKDAYVSATWVELMLAFAYQLFLLTDEASHIKALEHVLNVYEHAEQDGEIVRVLRDLLKEQLRSQIGSGVRETVQQLLQLIEAPEDSQEFLTVILGKVALEPSFSVELKATLSNKRGDVYYELDKYQQAIEDYDQAIKLNPDNADFYDARDKAYRQLSDYEQTIANQNHALGADS